MDQFLKYSGILLWALLALWLLLRLFLGPRWPMKLGTRFFLGKPLMASAKKLNREIKQKELQSETVTEVGVNVFKRLTRIGVFAVLAALIPAAAIITQTVLLNRQNRLFSYQNERINTQTTLDSFQTILIQQQTELLKRQDEKFGLQNELITDQNNFIDKQTGLLESQDQKLENQNQLFGLQNTLLDSQNYRLGLQNNLIEADRRGALVVLMSNIMDQLDREIREQKLEDQAKYDSIGYKLSDPLIGRIAALSQGFLPYRYLEGDTLTEREVSPERGQLLLSLVNSNLDSVTNDKIYQAAKFEYSYLQGADLFGANLFGSGTFSERTLTKRTLTKRTLAKRTLTEWTLSMCEPYQCEP